MPFNSFGPFDLTSFLSMSCLVSRRFDPLGGERDGPRVRRVGDLERRGPAGVFDLDELLDDVRPVVELRREVGTVSGLPMRSRVRYISRLRYSRRAMSFERDRFSRLDMVPDRDLSSRLDGNGLRDRDLSSRVRRLWWRLGWSSSRRERSSRWRGV